MSDPSNPSPQDWAAAWGLLDEVLALPLPDRAAWLESLSQRQPAHAEIVRRLLATIDQEESGTLSPFGRDAAARLFASALGGTAAILAAGSMIGDYRLVRPLGQGGMAQVWLAEQTAKVIRQVALKIPHAGLEPVAAAGGRFDRERDLLAGLEHERIARLYDAGVTADGVAFLAMEWIDGVPLTRYCDEHHLSIDARLALFGQVLEAVGFAHSRLVIHRDLKPSNILVSANGQVKLLDFGVANLLSDTVTDGEPGAALDAMTPDSASPEQLARLPLGTSSDVYSLGIVLYELLSGRKPYSLERSGPSLHAALMATTIGPLQAAVTAAAAQQRATSPDKLSRRLKGELGAIVERCLAKSPADRYPDVGALSSDLQRLVRHEPVQAYGHGTAYRLRCFARRQRWPLLAATALLLVMSAGIVATEWQARAALAQAQRAEAIQRFLFSLFRSNTPSESEGHELTAKELLKRGTERADVDLADQPRALAYLDSELGDIFNEMGDNQAAMAHLQRSIAGFAKLGLADSRPALEAAFRRGIVNMDDGQYAAARADMNTVLARGRALYGPKHRWAVGAREKLAFMLLDNNDTQAALDMAQEALAQPVGEDLANDALRRLRVKVIVGEAQTDLGDYVAARRTLTEAVAESNGASGYGVVDRLVYRLLLTRAIFFSGDFAAEPSAAQLVAEEERIFGKSHPLVFPARQLWSNALAAVGRYDEAVAVARETVNRAQTQVDPSGERIAMNQATLARRLIQSERYAEAEAVTRAAIGYYDQHNEKQSPLVHRTLADALMGEHRLTEAQREMQNSLDHAAHISGFANTFFWPDLLDSQSNVLRVAGEYTAAIAPLTDACARLNHSPGESSPQAHRCAALLAWLRAAQNPSDVALRAAFERAAQAYAALLPAQHLGRVELPLLGAQLDEMAGKATAVDVPLIRSAWKKILGIEPPAHILFLH